jgi:formylglycine-generating enzyme required for sulfatase activity
MKWGRVALVVVGAVIITALGIDAADTMRGSEGTLLSQVIRNQGGGCPNGMVPTAAAATVTCVDAFEASTNETCPVKEPQNILDSTNNAGSAGCFSESKEGALPWRFVSREQAMQFCARAGKRLPTSEEWYQLALGMADTDSACNTSTGQLETTGLRKSCSTQNGVYDLIGNVWEWVSDDVMDGVHDGLTLPESGYVAQVNSAGMAVISTSTEQELFDHDYFWSRSKGAYGLIRGGYYDNQSDAGIYSVHADTPPITAGTAIGFRCVL